MRHDPLGRRYAGKAAVAYEKSRRDNDRWRAENAAFTQLMDDATPRSVLDCPFGTGRWASWYETLPGPIVAIDRSADMLAEAREKVGEDPRYRLIEGDIFTYDFARHRGDIDLVVCVRFLNWITWRDAVTVLGRLGEVASPRMIVGITVTEGGAWSTMLQRLRITWRHALSRLSGRAPHYVHDRRAFEKAVEAAGWKVAARHRTFRRRFGVNDLYDLRRR